MALLPATIGKIKDFFANDREGRMPGFLDPRTGTASSRGLQPTGDFSRFDLFSYSNLEGVSEYLKVDNDLMARFRDYEEMDQYPEISTAYDIYGEDATTTNIQTGKTIEVEADDSNVKDRLNQLYFKNLKIEDEIWSIARTLVKYGNDYEEHIFKEGEGIIGYNPLPCPTVRRLETRKGGLLGYLYDLKMQFKYSPGAQNPLQSMGSKLSPAEQMRALEGYYDDYEVQHFRLRSRYRESVYGYGVAEPARWIWRRLMLLEDAALIYKLTRAPARYAFYVDVGGMPARQADAHVNKMRQRFRKKRFVDPTSGQLDFKNNPLSNMDDFWVPVREGGRRSAEIEVLSGPDYQSIDDIEYFRSKLFAALKVPKLFMNFDENALGRTTLSAEDVRFARAVMRIQRELRNGLKRTGTVHLVATGIDPASTEFEVYMQTPSAIFEMAQIEVQSARADLATRMGEFVSREWLLHNVFGMSDQEIEEVFAQREDEQMNQSEVDLQIQRTAAEMEAEVTGAATEEQKRTIEKSLKLVRTVRSQLNDARKSPERMDGYMRTGSRDAEKRVEDKLNQLLKSDKGLRKRLDESRMFMNELREHLKSARKKAA